MSDVLATAYRLSDCDGEGTIRTCAKCKQEVSVLADGGLRSTLPEFYICWECKTVWAVKARVIVPWVPGTEPKVTDVSQGS